MIYKKTSIGVVGVAEKDGFITGLDLPAPGKKETPGAALSPLLEKAFDQLERYFKGKLKKFDLPLKPEGTPFMQKVWEKLCQVPYGKTTTYKALAEGCGHPKAYRAVGLANNRNPIAIIIPCHRVVGSNGKLVGYAGGLELKQKLLEIEAG